MATPIAVPGPLQRRTLGGDASGSAGNGGAISMVISTGGGSAAHAAQRVCSRPSTTRWRDAHSGISLSQSAHAAMRGAWTNEGRPAHRRQTKTIRPSSMRAGLTAPSTWTPQLLHVERSTPHASHDRRRLSSEIRRALGRTAGAPSIQARRVCVLVLSGPARCPPPSRDAGAKPALPSGPAPRPWCTSPTRSEPDPRTPPYRMNPAPSSSHAST